VVISISADGLPVSSFSAQTSGTRRELECLDLQLLMGTQKTSSKTYFLFPWHAESAAESLEDIVLYMFSLPPIAMPIFFLDKRVRFLHSRRLRASSSVWNPGVQPVRARQFLTIVLCGRRQRASHDDTKDDGRPEPHGGPHFLQCLAKAPVLLTSLKPTPTDPGPHSRAITPCGGTTVGDPTNGPA
jgi:hypothetical protein